jgi:hypothetical protein
MKYALICFGAGCLNIYPICDADNSIVWFNWLSLGICAGLGIAILMNNHSDKKRRY